MRVAVSARTSGENPAAKRDVGITRSRLRGDAMPSTVRWRSGAGSGEPLGAAAATAIEDGDGGVVVGGRGRERLHECGGNGHWAAGAEEAKEDERLLAVPELRRAEPAAELLERLALRGRVLAHTDQRDQRVARVLADG